MKFATNVGTTKDYDPTSIEVGGSISSCKILRNRAGADAGLIINFIHRLHFDWSPAGGIRLRCELWRRSGTAEWIDV